MPSINEEDEVILVGLFEAGKKVQTNEYWAVPTLALILADMAVTKKLEHVSG